MILQGLRDGTVACQDPAWGRSCLRQGCTITKPPEASPSSCLSRDEHLPTAWLSAAPHVAWRTGPQEDGKITAGLSGRFKLHPPYILHSPTRHSIGTLLSLTEAP